MNLLIYLYLKHLGSYVKDQANNENILEMNVERRLRRMTKK